MSKNRRKKKLDEQKQEEKLDEQKQGDFKNLKKEYFSIYKS